MKLQLALDVFDLETAISVAEKTSGFVDIIEIGTPFLLEYGMEAVRRFRGIFSDKEILADTKIMDAGRIETAAAMEAGADYVTVLAVTDILTIRECVETARRYGKKIVADLICVDDIPEKVRALEEAGVHGIAVHTGVDQQKAGRTPLEDLRILKACSGRTEISVAGGINLKTVSEYAALAPDILIVGGAIGSAPDPVEAARAIHDRMTASCPYHYGRS